MKGIILILALAAPLVAQTNISQVNGDVRVTNVTGKTNGLQLTYPELTQTERIAIGAVSEKQQKNTQEAKALNEAAKAITADIATNHPGYHLDLSTPSGLVKDAPKEVKK